MPELPEVETVRRGLAARVVGRRIEQVEIGRERTVRRTSAADVVQGLTGATIVDAERRGKYLICPLDTGQAVMIHLRMSGRLLLAPAGALRPPHTHLVAHLAPSSERPAEELWFIDPRTFGEVVVFDPARASERVPELGRLGIDPVVDRFDRSTLRTLVLSRRRRLKALLLDQRVIAGIGNIYSDEIMHRARLRPDRVSDSLHGREIARLHAAILGVLQAAIETGGSTLRDTQYVDVTGSSGTYQVHHRVYGRAGQRCLTCRRGTVVSAIVAGRTTQYCPRCQR